MELWYIDSAPLTVHFSSSKMLQLMGLVVKITGDFYTLLYSACPGTSNLVWFSATFELNHSRITVIPLNLHLQNSQGDNGTNEHRVAFIKYVSCSCVTDYINVEWHSKLRKVETFSTQTIYDYMQLQDHRHASFFIAEKIVKRILQWGHRSQ